MDRWYYTRNNRQRIGPHTLAELRQLFANAVLQPSDMVLNDGNKEWVRAASIQELSGEQKVGKQEASASGDPNADTGVSAKSQQWYVLRDNAKCGPYSTKQMKEFITWVPPRVVPDDVVEKVGSPGVMRAKQCGELFSFAQKWYIIRDNVKYGPFTTEQMKEYIAAVPPILLRQDLVQTEGPPTFASQIEELFPSSNGWSREGVIYLVLGFTRPSV